MLATAFNRVVFEVPDVAKERDFYAGIWGMKVGNERPGEECLLQFGLNTLEIRRSAGKPGCRSYGFTIEDFDRAMASAELIRRGLKLIPDHNWDLAFQDPDGFLVGMSGA